MKPSIAFVKEKFCHYNKLIFNNSLPIPPITINHARTAAGMVCCTKSRILFQQKYSNLHIKISDYYDFDEKEWDNTIVHEMIHYYILYNQIVDTAPHGQTFRKLMNDINKAFGLNITVSTKISSSKTSDAHRRSHYICVSKLTDGRTGITLSAITRIWELNEQLPKLFRLERHDWYGSTDPYFNRYPHSITPKIYIVDETELIEKLKTAVQLIVTKDQVFRKKPSH